MKLLPSEMELAFAQKVLTLTKIRCVLVVWSSAVLTVLMVTLTPVLPVLTPITLQLLMGNASARGLPI